MKIRQSIRTLTLTTAAAAAAALTLSGCATCMSCYKKMTACCQQCCKACAECCGTSDTTAE